MTLTSISNDVPDDDDFEQIAVVGVAGRYPSSPDIRAVSYTHLTLPTKA